MISHDHKFANVLWALAAFAGLVLASGCGKAPQPEFILNFQGKNPEDSSDEQRQGLVDALVASFGTPDQPYVFEESHLDLTKIKLAAGPTYTDVDGTRGGLFRQHCVHCHGITGDGDGPTAIFLDPYPRDYRRGIFKFKSTQRAARPTDEDLKRILVNGVPGTAMPSFAMLPEIEIDALVEYVKYLSYRGETELFLYDAIVNGEEALPLSRAQIVELALAPVVEQWEAAPEAIIEPIDRPEPNIEEGRRLFLSADAQCTKCHGPTAIGDGGEIVFDDWNKDITPENQKFYDLPKQELAPRNLRQGIYRGGRRPVDLYRRIFAGINGTPMPASGPSPGVAKPPLTEEQIWHVVDYVMSLPYDPKSRQQTDQAALGRPVN